MSIFDSSFKNKQDSLTRPGQGGKRWTNERQAKTMLLHSMNER